MTSSNNRATVLAALKHLIGERNTAVIDTYVHDSYIQHSPQVMDGKAGLLEALNHLKQLPPPPPSAASPVVRTIADGDYVMLHMNIAFMGKKLAVVDLYRLEDGKLAEHWDATQEQLFDVDLTAGASVVEDLELTAVNKDVVRRFFHDRDARLFAADFISHSASLPTRGQVHRILGEGNFVMVQLSRGDAVFYDIWRLKDQLLAEHWQVAQVIPVAMPHGNGMI
jgi:predicted SnoaL-like aldol condensation-catalyzing enzyme